MSGSSWTWTITVLADRWEHTVSGAMDAPAAATPDDILQQVLKGLPAQYRGRDGGVHVVDFKTSRT